MAVFPAADSSKAYSKLCKGIHRNMGPEGYIESHNRLSHDIELTSRVRIMKSMWMWIRQLILI